MEVQVVKLGGRPRWLGGGPGWFDGCSIWSGGARSSEVSGWLVAEWGGGWVVRRCPGTVLRLTARCGGVITRRGRDGQTLATPWVLGRCSPMSTTWPIERLVHVIIYGSTILANFQAELNGLA